MDYNKLRKELIKYHNDHKFGDCSFVKVQFNSFSSFYDAVCSRGEIALHRPIMDIKSCFRCDMNELDSAEILYLGEFSSHRFVLFVKKMGNFVKIAILKVTSLRNGIKFNTAAIEYAIGLDTYKVIYGKECDIEKHTIRYGSSDFIKNIM